LCRADLLSCYYQPRADDLLGTYYYQSLSSATDTARQADVAAASQGEVGDGVTGGRPGRRVITRRLTVLAAVAAVLTLGITCRLTV